MIGRICLLFVLQLMLAGFPLASASGQQRDLRVGDVLRVMVLHDTLLSGDFRIMSNGTLAHPLYRELRVVDLPLASVEDSVESFLRRYGVNVPFVVEPLFRITVGGEVRAPNVYLLPPGTSIAEALATAGGGTEAAKLRAVRLQRTGTAMTIDVLEVGPDGAASMPIQSGDQIYVERRRNVWSWLAPVATITGTIASIATLISTRN
jgi:protein involved in polysaccharide export with SLBB domain